MQEDRGALARLLGSDTAKGVADAVIGFFTTKFIAAVIGFLFVTLGAPYALILLYALNAGLPAFEVFDAVGGYMTTFSVMCAIATIVLLMLVTLPGLLLMLDKWSVTKEQMASQLYFSRLRWYVCAVPGIAIYAAYMLFAGLLTDDPQEPSSWWLVPVSIILVAVLLLVCWLLFALYKGHKPKWRDCREVVRAPFNIPVITNIISFLYL